MTPYYQAGGITIYHGDCLQLLPQLALVLDGVLIDPPYASGARTEAAKPSSGAMLRGRRWDKRSYGLGHGFRSQHELICHASRGVPTIYARGVGNVLACPRVANDEHPDPKPVGLLEALLPVVLPPGGLVCDPCMGTGATLVAARRRGARAIGIECEERYCEMAARRRQQAVLPLTWPAHVPEQVPLESAS
jgi:site-specific DNA-methyltransferase (adenine-specific)